MSKRTLLPYFAAFTVAAIGAAVAMGGVAITYLAQENPKLAAILGAGYAVMLGFSKVLPTPDAIVHPATTLNVERADSVTQNIPPPAETDTEAAARISAPHRNPHGQFARRVPPVDRVADS